MNNITIGLILVIVILVMIIIFRPKKQDNSYKKRQSYIDRHDKLVSILLYYMEKAYDIIYKDRIIAYSISGTKPDPDEMKQNSIDYGKVVLKLLGPNLIKEFTFLYGDEETFMFTIMEYFNTVSEHDEIKQDSINNIMEGSDEKTI